MKYVIFADENIPYIEESLKDISKVVKFSGRLLTNQQLISAGCNVLFTRSQTLINRKLLQNTYINFVATATSGSDHFDIEYLKEQGIIFSDAIGSNANSVAEYVIYSILKWADINSVNLKEKSIGIIGFGNIGKLVAKYCKNLNMRILINDPPLLDANFDFPENLVYSNLDKIFSECDIITNHVPLTKTGKYKTNQLFDLNLLKYIRNDSLFIHASRGGVVNEKDLLKLKTEKKITCVIDVWENEPDFNVELAGNSMIATPHIAGYSRDGKLKGTMMVLDAFEKKYHDYINRKELLKELNQYKPLSLEYYQDHKNLLNLLSESRKIDDDYFNLQKLFIYEKVEKSKEFDNLRKNYPLRREIL